jgi:hypothetical protein
MRQFKLIILLVFLFAEYTNADTSPNAKKTSKIFIATI